MHHYILRIFTYSADSIPTLTVMKDNNMKHSAASIRKEIAKCGAYCLKVVVSQLNICTNAA